MNSNEMRIGDYVIERRVLDEVGRDLRLYGSHKLRKRILEGKIHMVRRRIANIYHESAGPPDGMPRGSGVSNPTLAKVEKHEELEEKIALYELEIAELDTWFAEVDAVLVTLPEAHRFIIEQRFLLPHEEQELTAIGVASRLCMSRVEAWRNQCEALLRFALVLRRPEVRASNPFIAKVERNPA